MDNKSKNCIGSGPKPFSGQCSSFQLPSSGISPNGSAKILLAFVPTSTCEQIHSSYHSSTSIVGYQSISLKELPSKRAAKVRCSSRTTNTLQNFSLLSEVRLQNILRKRGAKVRRIFEPPNHCEQLFLVDGASAHEELLQIEDPFRYTSEEKGTSVNEPPLVLRWITSKPVLEPQRDVLNTSMQPACPFQ